MSIKITIKKEAHVMLMLSLMPYEQLKAGLQEGFQSRIRKLSNMRYKWQIVILKAVKRIKYWRDNANRGIYIANIYKIPNCQ